MPFVAPSSVLGQPEDTENFMAKWASTLLTHVLHQLWMSWLMLNFKKYREKEAHSLEKKKWKEDF